MKKIGFVLLLLSFLMIDAQETPTERRNDIIGDPIMLIAVPAANVTYERILTEHNGLGLNVIIGLGEDNTGFSQFSPYYRFYFGKNFASGFFLEGFVPITTFKDHEMIFISNEYGGYYTESEKEIKRTAAGAGFGVGGKWVVRNGLVIEASGGIARLFGDTGDDIFSEVTGRIMAGIGYRF
ncbi:hypothetical protein [Chryseobacterium sp. MFBS3-17]|uniref:hypothetical protein n=1 Tax=Chryseobacterium sp. MFBS3-17 TaxID=2886689 RepID=UPI001D0F097E|nr:hypothetical protein [Chryseobacterium sp. MFBS3-17]MCC2590488.1 hypothetical protein [Chryseobacterium sp. MFBS3-17]